MSISISNNGSIRAKGKDAQAIFDALVKALDPPKPRNPCINPQPGDQVTVAAETREVESVNGDRVIYSWPGKVAVRTMYISAWRAWAATATTHHTAEVEPA